MFAAPLALAIAIQASSNVQPDLVVLFSGEAMRLSRNGPVYHYRLFEPERTGEPELYPLVVWLHGYGERGDDNLHQLKWLDSLMFRAPRRRERFRFYFLAVQCPRRQDVWFDRTAATSKSRPDMLEITHAIVQRLLREKPIDVDRVYLSGLSGGGTACWEYASRYPDTFAAVLPLGGGRAHPATLNQLSRTPIWAFHSTADERMPVAGVRHTVTALKGAGGNVALTEIASTEHDCWCAAFREHHAFDWLMSQRRGHYATAGRHPFVRQIAYMLAKWAWWQMLLQVLIVIVPLSLIWKVLRWMGDSELPKRTASNRRRPDRRAV